MTKEYIEIGKTCLLLLLLSLIFGGCSNDPKKSNDKSGKEIEIRKEFLQPLVDFEMNEENYFHRYGEIAEKEGNSQVSTPFT